MKYEPHSYHSGTCVVMPNEAKQPWLYVYGPVNPDEGKRHRQRFAMCRELADFLNGGVRPTWLDDMERKSETEATDLDGSSIVATGPMIDRDPPKCSWCDDESDAAKAARARLMDRLFLSEASHD